MAGRAGPRSVGTVSTHHAMSTADAAWLRMDRPTNLMIVNSVLWFDEPVDWERCKAVFLDRIVARFDRFRQRAADGLPLAPPHWEDDPGFDPALHFHHVALPAPHDRAALQDFIGDRIATPLDRSRPLWEVYLIDDFGSGCAILVRIHHSIADGIALARVMLTLTDGGEPGAGIAEAEDRERLAPRGARVAGPRRRPRGDRDAHAPRARADARRRRGRRHADARQAAASRRRSEHRDQGRAVGRPPRRLVRARPALAGQARRPGPWRDRQRRARRRGHRRGRPPPPRPGRRGRRGARARPLQPAPARPAAPARARQPLRARAARAARRHRRSARAAGRGQAPDGRDQGQPRGRVRLRHPRPDGPHAGPARGAPDRLLHRQGLDGPHQRARARAGGCPSPARRWPASSSGRRARAASG